MRYSVHDVLDKTDLQYWVTPNSTLSQSKVDSLVKKAAEDLGDRVESVTDAAERRVRMYSEHSADEYKIADSIHIVRDHAGGYKTPTATVCYHKQRPHTAELRYKAVERDSKKISSESTLSIRLPQLSGTIAGKLFAYQFALRMKLELANAANAAGAFVALEGVTSEGVFMGTEFDIHQEYHDDVRARKASADEMALQDENAGRFEKNLDEAEKKLTLAAQITEETLLETRALLANLNQVAESLQGLTTKAKGLEAQQQRRNRLN